MRKDSPSVGDVHVSAAIGATKPKRRRTTPAVTEVEAPDVVEAVKLAMVHEGETIVPFRRVDDEPVDVYKGVPGRHLMAHPEDAMALPFRTEPRFLQRLRPDQALNFTHAITHVDELPTEVVPLASLVGTQDRVRASKVIEFAASPPDKTPVVVRDNGVDYVGDGHCRLTAAWLRGEDDVMVAVQDLTTQDQTAKAIDGEVVSLSVKVAKVVPDKRQVFGWMSVCTKGGEYFFDKQDDMILVEALEPAVYEYVLSSRVGGDMHVEKGVSRLIESMMFTKEKQDALGVDLGQEGWWVGYQIDSPPLWSAIKRGERPEFSIGGAAVSIPYETWMKSRL